MAGFSFAVRKFEAIPKIVGRGRALGSGKGSMYNFADLKEECDGFEFPTIMVKKIRAAIQAYRLNAPRYRYVIRELTPSTMVDGVSQNDGTSACILNKVMTPQELAAWQSERAALKAAQDAQSNANAVEPKSTEPTSGTVVADSVDDALAGLDI